MGCKKMKIDAHNHFIPQPLLDFIRKEGTKVNTEIIQKDGKEYIKHSEGFMYPLFQEFYDTDKKIKTLEHMQMQHAVLSVSPTVFYYWAEESAALHTSMLCNDWVSRLSKDDPEHFSGMATLPMQNVPLALKELERAHEKLGLNAIEIGPNINEKNLDEKEFFPIYEYCAANDVLIMLHPYYTGIKPEYSKYYSINLVAGVFETNFALNHLIFGGVFEQFPELKILAVHGGGYFPYQFGRLMHGYEVREEPKVNIHKSPDHYLKGIYYDTITHWNPALQFLVDNFGADHVVVGTDAPFDMGDYTPAATVDSLKLTQNERELIYTENISKLMQR